jgi:hypothetical protein
LVEKIAIKYEISQLRSGVYYKEGEGYSKDRQIEIDYLSYFLQLIVWNMIVTLSKFILFFVQLLFASPLNDMGEAALSPFKDSPKLELIVVMVIVPVTLNSV